MNPLDHPICFSRPLRLDSLSAWNEHVPFGMLLVDLARPKTLVELGTQNGVSYCAFCQAVKQLGLDTHCYAVDTWAGDAQAGFYGPEVLANLRAHHDPLYGEFSRLVQSTFDAAVNYFHDQSVDLLHIDGLHTYEAVKHDFETWLPKLSEHAVVLLHDTNVRERDFGVWKLWTELQGQFPNFEFFHGHGLGVLGIGEELPAPLRPLFSMPDEQAKRFREFFFSLGFPFSSISEKDRAIGVLSSQIDKSDQAIQALSSQLTEKEQAVQALTGQLAEKEQAVEALAGQVAENEQAVQALTGQVAEKEQAVEALTGQVAKKEQAVQALAGQVAEKEQAVEALTGQVAEKEQAVQALTGQVAEIKGSRAWRAAMLARRIRALLIPPGSLRARAVRKAFSPIRAFRTNRDLALIQKSGLFERSWYLTHNLDVAQSGMEPARHYLLMGGIEGRDPGPNFSSQQYLDTYEDVRRSGMNPLLHFVKFGQREGRIASASTLGVVDGITHGSKKPEAPTRPKRNPFPALALSRGLKWARSFYRRLPMSASFRFRLQGLAYKTFPSGYIRLKNAVDRAAYEGVADDTLADDVGSPFAGNAEAKSGLALCASLLEIDETRLTSLLRPPAWHADRMEGAFSGPHEATSHAAAAASSPRFTIVLLANSAPAHFVNAAIQSVRTQSNQDWELNVYVGQPGPWSVEALSVQFGKAERRIHVRGSRFMEGSGAAWKQAVEDAAGEYVIFLSGYDEFEPDVLRAAAREASTASLDLILAAKDGPIHGETVLRDGFHDLSRTGCESNAPISFCQFIAWRKAFLERLLPEESSSASDSLIHIRDELVGRNKPHKLGVIASPAYFFRPIPGRAAIRLNVNSGSLDLEPSVVPLRVLVDARLMSRETTGTERYLLELLEALSLLRREHHLELRALVPYESEKRIEGVEFIRSNPLDAIRDCDVYHKAFPASDGGTLAEMALAPSVVFTPLDLILFTHQDYYLHQRDFQNYRRIMRLAAGLSDRILSISDHGKMELETLLHVPSRKVKTVYLGVRPERFALEAELGKDRIAKLRIPDGYFLFVGTNYPHKNLITLLRALDLVRQRIPSAHLVAIGSEYYLRPQPELDVLLKQLSGHVTRLGHVPEETLLALYHHASALVYPSLYEGFGLPIIEAMLCGIPVIASNSTSIPEVTGSEAAILADGRDETQLARAMINIREDPQLRSRLIAAGYQQAAGFTWNKTAIQTIQSYQEAVREAMRVPAKKRMAEKLSVMDEIRRPPTTILIVAHIRLYPPAAGNELRLFRMVKYLKKLGYQIVMLVNPLETSKLDRETRKALYQYVDYYEEIGDVAVDPGGEHAGDSEIGREQILANWRIVEQSFCPDALMHRASQLIEQFSPKIILAEYIWMSRVFALATPDMLKVVDTIDVFSHKQGNVIDLGIQDGLAITSEEELAFINRSDAIIAIQDSEAEAFRALAPTCRVITAGIDVDPVAEGTVAHTPSPTVLIVGSGNPINVHCVQEFLKEAWPRIHQAQPSCNLRIVGKVCGSLTVTDPSVALIPYASDLDMMYQDARVVINPVYAGTGIKVKSVEAIGHGKVLVSWPEGVAGISIRGLQPFVVVQSWDELVKSVVGLIDEPDRRHELEAAALEFAKTSLAARTVYREVADCLDTFSKRNLNVLNLFLRYGTDDYPDAMQTLQDWYRGKMAEANVTTWIVDNKLAGDIDTIDLATGFRLLSGNNAQSEFSAFQKILTQHRPEIEQYDLIHFVTSAFHQLFTGYLDYCPTAQLAAVAHRHICLGHLDSYDEPVEIDGQRTQSWIRTCFFFVAPETAYSIPGFVAFDQESRFFDGQGAFIDNGRLSENYKKYITGWLNGEIIQGMSWHSQIQGAGAFQRKVLAILNEHMLSVRLRKAGIDLADFYWLNENRGKVESSVDYPIPDWQEQLRVRQTGLHEKAG